MTHEELQDLLNTDLTQPHPDPSWDYYGLWMALNEHKRKVEKLIKLVSTQEKSSKDFNQIIERDLFILVNEFEEIQL